MLGKLVVKSVGNCQSLLSSSLPRISAIKLQQLSLFSSQSESAQTQNMDQAKQDPSAHKTGNVMSHSFGEGYATRSDEEGFGGIYQGNQAVNNINADKFIHENHPAYDRTQGSEVREKERSRHQSNA